MAFGMGALRLPPDAFWGMTLRELAAVLRGVFPERGRFERSGLSELMRRFPDA